MKNLLTTKNFEAILDDDVWDVANQWSWYAHASKISVGTTIYKPARRSSVEEGRKVIFLPSLVLPKREGLVVDHINGDVWDNRRVNLRYCTIGENTRNRKRHTNKESSSYKGVYFNYKTGKYIASICKEGKTIYLGQFKNEISAALAYDQGAKLHHGEFARTNF